MQVEKAVEELVEAKDYQTKSRKKKIILAVVLAGVVIVVVIVIVNSLSSASPLQGVV